MTSDRSHSARAFVLAQVALDRFTAVGESIAIAQGHASAWGAELDAVAQHMRTGNAEAEGAALKRVALASLAFWSEQGRLAERLSLLWLALHGTQSRRSGDTDCALREFERLSLELLTGVCLAVCAASSDEETRVAPVRSPVGIRP